MGKINLHVSKKMIALLAAGGIAFAPVEATIGEPRYVEGTFVKEVEQDETAEYGQYVVMEDDNLSKISEKICGHYHQEVSTKYWPALAFLNGYPRVINPGDIIVFPKDFERLVAMNEKLRKSGWTAKYITNNNIYGKKRVKKKLSYEYARILLEDIYGDDVCVDYDFVKLYMDYKGLDDYYYLAPYSSITTQVLADFTESLPPLEELYKYQEKVTRKR